MKHDSRISLVNGSVDLSLSMYIPVKIIERIRPLDGCVSVIVAIQLS